MATIASFTASKKTKKWCVSDKYIMDLKDLSTGFELNAETNDAIEGSPLTNQRGMKKKSLSFSSSLNASLGVDVRKEFESWEWFVGRHGTLKFGGVKFGNKWLLTSVKPSDIRLDDSGRFRSMTLGFVFEEYIVEKTESLVVDSVKGDTSASDVTAPPEDKNDKKPTNIDLDQKPAGGGAKLPNAYSGIIEQ